MSAGLLWLLTTTGKLLAFRLPDGPLETVGVADEVADLEVGPSGVFVLTRSWTVPRARMRLWRFTGTEWQELGRPDVPSCAITSQLARAGVELVLTDNRGLFEFSMDGANWKGSPFDYPPAFFAHRMVCTRDKLCVVGGNRGEFGGGFLLYDLKNDPRAKAVRDEGADAGRNVTALLVDPRQPSCILIGLGYFHMGLYSGGVLRACRDGVTYAIDVMPKMTGGMAAGLGAPVLSLAPSSRGYYMVTMVGLFEVVNGMPRPVALPHIDSADGLRMSRDVADTLVVLQSDRVRAAHLVRLSDPASADP